MPIDINLVIAGFFVGALVGLTGMGGGAVMTPFLISVVGVSPVLAVGTDLVYSAATKIGAVAPRVAASPMATRGEERAKNVPRAEIVP